MADQCIVCLENLDVQSVVASVSQTELSTDALDLHTSEQAVPEAAVAPVQTRSTSTTNGNATVDDDTKIAEIEVCGHVLHDSCLREWTDKANSCPICRQSFNFVNVYDKVGGTKLSSYTVEDRKQIAEFDAQAWLDENPDEEEPTQPCIICQNSEHEELTLLCDSCDAPYHTYCVGLDCVPRGHWLCMECNAQYRAVLGEELEEADEEEEIGRGRSDYLPRTQATMRRARRRARSDEWQGAWGQIASHVFEALDLDLDNHDDDEALQNYRRAQRRRERESQEYRRWQQRLSIANRLGAGDTFANNLARGLPQRQPQRQPARPPPPPRETVEEKKAWGALEKAMEATSSNSSAATPNRRKRKSRSASGSPREPVPEPERRLKRPRTRRMPQSGEASSSRQNGESSASIAAPVAVALPIQTASLPTQAVAPTFLSSLLKEVAASKPSDDENVRNFFGSLTRPSADASSPAGSPSPSGPSSPRALSTTPPPRGIADRPGSPLTLSSHIEPIYPPMASFSPNRIRAGGDHSGSDSESTSQRQHRPNGSSHHLSIRNPQPRRHKPASINTDMKHSSLSPESSPTRDSLSLKTKESISAMIKAALKPHYNSGSITADEYTNINRDLSRRLYKEVPEVSIDEDMRRHCEKLAHNEVAKAVSDLKEIKV